METDCVETVGLVSDIHGNLAALEAVLADMPNVDAVVNAGDIVGYGPWPAECVSRVRHPHCHSVMGNHDQALFEGQCHRKGDAYANEVLSSDQHEWLRALPDSRLLFDNRLKVVHGHPDERFDYTFRPEFDEKLLNGEDVLVLGHTHRQGATRVDGDRIVVNPGSVGQPRDNDSRAAYAVLHLDDLALSLKRIPYDIDRVRDRIEETPIPERYANRLYRGK